MAALKRKQKARVSLKADSQGNRIAGTMIHVWTPFGKNDGRWGLTTSPIANRQWQEPADLLRFGNAHDQENNERWLEH